MNYVTIGGFLARLEVPDEPVGQVSLAIDTDLVEACGGVIGTSRVTNLSVPVRQAPFQSRRSLG